MTDNNNITYDRTSYILVVDDDKTLLKFFKIHLNKFFSRVIVVKNAKEAVEMLKDKEVDLVISDIRMPRTDGIQLMKKVRNFDSSIPVMLISGAMLTDEQTAITEEVADGFLRKPFSVDELHGLIDFGMAMREKLKELKTIVPDNKRLRDILRGKAKIKSLPVEKNLIARAEALYSDLKSEMKKAS